MLNAEKFLEEIKDVDYCFALKENKILKCDSFEGCSDCAFQGSCWLNRTKWLLEEYKEPILTDEAKAYLKAILEPIEGYQICKVSCFAANMHELIFYNGSEYASLKYKTGTKLYKYFKGLDYDRSYSLEEL